MLRKLIVGTTIMAVGTAMLVIPTGTSHTSGQPSGPPSVPMLSHNHEYEDISVVTTDPTHGKIVDTFHERFRDFVMESCGPCMPGDVPGKTIERDWRTAHPSSSSLANTANASAVAVPNTNGDDAYGTRESMTQISQGYGCIWGTGDCFVDMTYHQWVIWKWFLGVVYADLAWGTLDGCGAIACLNWGWNKNPTWHGTGSYEHNDLGNAYVDDTNVQIAVLAPASFDTGGHYVTREPWGFHLSLGNGSYWWDTGIDEPYYGCSYPTC